MCTSAVDLRVNELLAVEMFTAWQIAAPRAGDMFPRCGICGGAAHRESRDGVGLHTPPRGKLGDLVGVLAGRSLCGRWTANETEVAVIDKLLAQAITALVGLAIGAVACEAGTAVFTWILN